jgi:hypothetical protein
VSIASARVNQTLCYDPLPNLMARLLRALVIELRICAVRFRVIPVTVLRCAMQVIVIVVGMIMSVTMLGAILMTMLVRVLIRLHAMELYH